MTPAHSAMLAASVGCGAPVTREGRTAPCGKFAYCRPCATKLHDTTNEYERENA